VIKSSFYSHFKANEMPFPMTYYTNIFSTVMYPRSSHLTFNFVFLKMRHFNFFEQNILCGCNYYFKHLQISSWDCNGFGVCEAVYCEEPLHLYSLVHTLFLLTSCLTTFTCVIGTIAIVHITYIVLIEHLVCLFVCLYLFCRSSPLFYNLGLSEFNLI
jgi:hypothetical protein